MQHVLVDRGKLMVCAHASKEGGDSFHAKCTPEGPRPNLLDGTHPWQWNETGVAN